MRTLIIGIAVLTSIVVLLAFARGERRPSRRLTWAARLALETIGATVLLFALNGAVGTILVLGGRRFTPVYLSLYDVSDVSLLVLSLFQALVLQGWRVVKSAPDAE